MSLHGKTALQTDSLLALFFMAWRGFAAEPDAILARHGLGRVHHRVLYAVQRVAGITVGDLAATLGVTRQALHGPLSQLVQRRLIVRRVSPQSARERSLHLTDRGAKLEDEASGAQRAQLDRIFAALGPHDAHAWARVMRMLAEPVISRSPGELERLLDA